MRIVALGTPCPRCFCLEPFLLQANKYGHFVQCGCCEVRWIVKPNTTFVRREDE